MQTLPPGLGPPNTRKYQENTNPWAFRDTFVFLRFFFLRGIFGIQPAFSPLFSLFFSISESKILVIRKALDTLNSLRHVMGAILSVRPKCSHRCVSLKEIPVKAVQILKHTTKDSTEQTAMRTKWLKLYRDPEGQRHAN